VVAAVGDQHALVDQCAHDVGHFGEIRRVVGTNRFHRPLIETAGENGAPMEDRPFD
jgi:hypothetical protein